MTLLWLTRLVTPKPASRPSEILFRCEFDSCREPAKWHVVMSLCRHSKMACEGHYNHLRSQQAKAPVGQHMLFAHDEGQCYLGGNQLRWRELL